MSYMAQFPRQECVGACAHGGSGGPCPPGGGSGGASPPQGSRGAWGAAGPPRVLPKGAGTSLGRVVRARNAGGFEPERLGGIQAGSGLGGPTPPLVLLKFRGRGPCKTEDLTWARVRIFTHSNTPRRVGGFCPSTSWQRSSRSSRTNKFLYTRSAVVTLWVIRQRS